MIGRMFAEMGAELQRLGTQGKAEVAHALFSHGNTFVAYGVSQVPTGVQHDQAHDGPQAEQAGPEVRQPEVEMER